MCLFNDVVLNAERHIETTCRENNIDVEKLLLVAQASPKPNSKIPWYSYRVTHVWRIVFIEVVVRTPSPFSSLPTLSFSSHTLILVSSFMIPKGRSLEPVSLSPLLVEIRAIRDTEGQMSCTIHELPPPFVGGIWHSLSAINMIHEEITTLEDELNWLLDVRNYALQFKSISFYTCQIIY